MADTKLMTRQDITFGISQEQALTAKWRFGAVRRKGRTYRGRFIGVDSTGEFLLFSGPKFRHDTWFPIADVSLHDLPAPSTGPGVVENNEANAARRILKLMHAIREAGDLTPILGPDGAAALMQCAQRLESAVVTRPLHEWGRRHGKVLWVHPTIAGDVHVGTPLDHPQLALGYRWVKMEVGSA